VGSTEQTKTGNLIIEGVLRLGQFTTANAPAGTEGALYFNTTEKKTKVYSNTAWADLGGGWDDVLPNYTTAQRDAIASPAYGLMVYNTDSYRVEYYLPDAWAAIQAPFAGGHSCTAAIDCASEICVDGYCCNTLCTGNCNRCNVVGSLGTCTEVASDCTGNCDVCSAGNCIPNASACTGNCVACSGSGTAYNCAAVDATCTGNCDVCSGSGTAYSCAASVALCSTSTCTCTGSGAVFNCSSPAIGTSCQGGKVAYVDGTGLHGLIAALSDQSTGVLWGCYGTAISGADGTAIGTGLQNTIDIMAGCSTAGIAARLCRGVTINGYSDWYLPSKDELNQLYINRIAIGGFTTYYYWSSSENASGSAWGQYWDGGAQGSAHKDNPSDVRAVRGF